MAKYSGKPVTLNHSAEDVYDKISDLGAFQQRLEALPAEAREKLGDVRFTSESIIINAPAVGEMKFNIARREPAKLLRFEAENSPVPFAINIDLNAVEPEQTVVTPTIEVDIPPMLRPLIGNKLQESADKFGEMFTNLFA